MAKLSDRILGERVSGYVTKPNLLDNSNFQVTQRGDSGSLVSGEYKLDRYSNLLDHDGATTYAQPPSGEGTSITTTGAATIGASNTQFETKILQRQYNLIRGKDAQMSMGVTSNADCNVFFRLVTYKAGATTITQLSDPLPVLANVDTEVSFTFPVADVGDLSSDPADRIDVQFFTDNLNEVTTVHWVKLEEGNVFTGYEPTPYAIDEAECKKWFNKIKLGWAYYVTANVTLRHGVPVSPAMFSDPTVEENEQITGDATVNRVDATYIEISKSSGGSGTQTSRNRVSLTCEL